ncbi:MAG: disulfide bond formation protein B [Pseudomonadota bacterium]
MRFLTAPRAPYLALAAACGVLMAIALYMQYGMGLTPCNLCMFQRVAVMAVGVVALIAGLAGPRAAGRWWASAGLLLTSGVGMGLAGRQLWLQSLPADQVPACGPDLEWMMDTYPFTEMVMEVLRGSGDCAEVQWTFLGGSIPAWTMAFFVVAALWGLAAALLKRA